MRIYMQISVPDGHDARFYHLLLQPDLLGGWTLVREWGRQGASGRIRRDHFHRRDEAEHAMIKTRDQQLGRGYRVVFIQGMEQP